MSNLKTVRDALERWDNQGVINHDQMCSFIEFTRSALSRMIETPAPQGWKLVPIEPTCDMMRAGSQVWKDDTIGTWGHAACVYKSMIDTVK